MPENIPEGQRFDQVYTERGEPTEDSERMRIRMRSLVLSFDALKYSTIVADELGLDIRHWSDFFRTAKTKDILTLVTLVYRQLAVQQYVGQLQSERWLREVERIFSEENIRYRVDRWGGVHPRVDQEFEHTSAAAISILQIPRYANSLDAFNKSLAALAESPADGKEAIRKTFAAIEGLVRLMLPDAPRLASGVVSKLGLFAVQSYAGDRPAIESAEKSIQSLARWIDAAHPYRHEEGKPDTVAQPPLDLAIYLVSTGASHLRWIARLDIVDQKANSKTT